MRNVQTSDLGHEWPSFSAAKDKDLPRIKEKLTQIFSEKEVVDLTACISIMNALNRIAITLRTDQDTATT